MVSVCSGRGVRKEEEAGSKSVSRCPKRGGQVAESDVRVERPDESSEVDGVGIDEEVEVVREDEESTARVSLALVARSKPPKRGSTHRTPSDPGDCWHPNRRSSRTAAGSALRRADIRGGFVGAREPE